MLKTTSVYLSICLVLFSNVIENTQAQDDPKTSNEHADYHEPAPHAPPAEEPHEAPPPAAAGEGATLGDAHLPADDQPYPEQPNEPPGQDQAAPPHKHDFGQPDEGYYPHDFTDSTRTTDKEERKLTPEMVEKFTAPLLENRWKWDYRREALVKNFWFASFNEAFGFMSRVALRAEKIRHHPEWYNSLNRVKVTLWTNKVNGLTYKDIIMARFIDKTEQFFEKKPPPAHLTQRDEYYAPPDQPPNPPPQDDQHFE